MFQPLTSLASSAPDPDKQAAAGLAGDSNAVEALWHRLEAFAHLPTQLSFFVAALSQTLLADGIVEIAFGAGAMLPLCRVNGYLARWQIAGSREVFEPVDALSSSPDAMRSLADILAGQPRPLAFDRIPADSELIPALRRAMRWKGLVLIRPAVSRPIITLDDGWMQPEARFNSGRQSDFRRALRRAQRHGQVSFEVLTPTPSGLDTLFDEAVGVELRSWKKYAGTAMGVEPRKAEFFKRYFQAACENGLVRIAFMRIDGRPIAMQMALEWADRFWLFKIGYDEEYRDCSPGNLLMLQTLAYAASRGLKSYELLGNTERWISDFWTKEHASCRHLRTYPANPRGVLALAIDTGTWLLKRVARSR